MDKQREKLAELLCRVTCEGGEDFGNCPERRNGHCRSIHRLEMCQVGAIANHILADEEIKHAFELLKAEKEGRLLETPCKVGDIVLLLYRYKEIWQLNPITVCALIYGKSGFVIRGTDCGCDIWELREDRIGKDVFLSCEEAYKAMEERENN